MSYHQNTPEGKDPQLWQLAQKRASFKKHLATYVVVNLFLWAIWYMGDQHDSRGIPWPVYPTLGWGLGLVFQYIGAYVTRGDSSVENEYNKLTNQK